MKSAHLVEIPTKLRQAAQLSHAGQLARAQALYEQVLQCQPDQHEALHLLGVIAARTRQFERAVELIGKAIGVDPHNAAAHNDMGVACKALGRWDAALASYDRAIALQPNFAEAYNNRGNVLRNLRQLESALASFDRAIVLRRTYAEAYNNRGVVLNDLHRWEEALTSYQRALALQPHFANAYSNRGVTLERLNHLEATLADYDQAIAINPSDAQAWANRGNVLRDLGHASAAVASCDRALALEPHLAQAHHNKGLALLLAGDFQRGWSEFEWRWKYAGSPLLQGQRSFAQPLWLGGESIGGKTILLHAEQGLGDTIQFCRYAKQVADCGARVILEVQRPLLEVLKHLDGVTRLVARGDALPDFDLQCPLLSLPLALGTTLTSIPVRVPYLQADPAKVQFWRAQLGTKRRPRVGLVWSGGFRPQQPEIWSVNSRRNIPLLQLAPLALPDLEFHSLQKGQPAESELADLVAKQWDGPQLIDSTGLLVDFADTAALIANLDLVISVDTSTAHLAGAMGKPVWVLNRFDTCWRWLLDRSDSPWYPTVRLYRQARLGDWDTVVRRVREDLLRWATTDGHA